MESGVRHTLPMLITATHQSKEQEQGREGSGGERIGHHCGGPLPCACGTGAAKRRHTRNILPCFPARTAMYTRSQTPMAVERRKCLPKAETPGHEHPVSLFPLPNTGFCSHWSPSRTLHQSQLTTAQVSFPLQNSLHLDARG